MTNYLFIYFLFFCWTAIAQNSQFIYSDSTEYHDSLLAQARLSVSIATNKSTYLPGEGIELTLFVKNPTGETLRVRDPFNRGNGRFVTINSVKPSFSLFTYNEVSVPLKVSDANLVQAFEFSLPRSKMERDVFGRAKVTEARYQRIISVQGEVKARLCLALGITDTLEYSRFPERLGGELRISKLGSFFGGLRCVAESNSPITSLDATFSSDGTMLLLGTAADKSTWKLYVDIKNKVIH